MAAFTPFPEAVPVSDYQLTYRTSEDGVVSLKMGPTGTPPEQVFQRKDGFWFSYSPDGKYIAVVVADMQNAVISAAKLAAKSNARPVGEGVAPDAIASSSGSLHPATPRWIEIIDASTFQTLHKLEGVAGLEEYFYWSPRSRYIVTWQPLSVPNPSTAYTGQMTSPSTPPPTLTTSQNSASSTDSKSGTTDSSSAQIANLKVWDVQTGKVVMQFKHAQRQGWPIVRWTEDEKIATRWASGQIHLYHWAKATFNQSPEENFAAMTRETIDKQNVWDWSIARSALAIFIRPNGATNAPGHVHLYPLNTTMGEEPGSATSANSSQEEAGSEAGKSSIASPAGKSGKTSASSPGQQGKKGQQHSNKGQNSKNSKASQLAAINFSAPLKEPDFGGQTPTKPTYGTSSSTSQASSSNGSNTGGGAAATEATPAVIQRMAPEQPVSSKSFFSCDDVKFRWHNRGQAVLVLAETQRDESGSGKYYGNTSVYYLPADGKGECDVTTDKEGPIHDARWNAKGNDFAITYGEYPSKTTLYNRKCKALGHLGTESRNTLVWSPQGRVLMNGGFGQLPGNFDIWDTVSLTKLGSAQSFTSALHEWSPDGKFLLSAALWPRMRVDNFFSVYDLKANLLVHAKLTELWKITWRPQPGCASAYPTSTLDPIIVSQPPQIASTRSSSPFGGAASSSSFSSLFGGANGGGSNNGGSSSSSSGGTGLGSSSAPYRPPGAKRAAASQFAQSQVPVKEQKVAPERFAPPSNPSSNPPKGAKGSSASSSSSSKVPVGGIPVKKSSSPSQRQGKPSGGK